MKKLLLAVPVMTAALLLTGCQPAEEGDSEKAETAKSAQARWDALPKNKKEGICEVTLDGDSSGMLKALESVGFDDDMKQMVPLVLDECTKK